jgi:hypothetical protein
MGSRLRGNDGAGPATCRPIPCARSCPCAARRILRCRAPAPAPRRAAVLALVGRWPCRSSARSVAHALLQRGDGGAFLGAQQVGIGRPAPTAWPAGCARPRPALRAARARPCRPGGRVVRILQHARDLVVAQAVGRLDGDRGFHAGTRLARRHRQQAVGIDLVGHADARRAGRHRRDAAQLEARQRTAVGHQLALALHHVHGQRGLAVLEGGEFLRARAREWSNCAG